MIRWLKKCMIQFFFASRRGEFQSRPKWRFASEKWWKYFFCWFIMLRDISPQYIVGFFLRYMWITNDTLKCQKKFERRLKSTVRFIFSWSHDVYIFWKGFNEIISWKRYEFCVLIQCRFLVIFWENFEPSDSLFFVEFIDLFNDILFWQKSGFWFAAWLRYFCDNRSEFLGLEGMVTMTTDAETKDFDRPPTSEISQIVAQDTVDCGKRFQDQNPWHDSHALSLLATELY